MYLLLEPPSCFWFQLRLLQCYHRFGNDTIIIGATPGPRASGHLQRGVGSVHAAHGYGYVNGRVGIGFERCSGAHDGESNLVMMHRRLDGGDICRSFVGLSVRYICHAEAIGIGGGQPLRQRRRSHSVGIYGVTMHVFMLCTVFEMTKCLNR